MRKQNNGILITGEDGKSLAIAGIICSIVGFFYGLYSLLFLFKFFS